MTSPTEQSVDEDLVELEDVVLRQAGYVIEPGNEDGLPYLIAEDKDSVVIASAVLTADDVQAVEPVLTRLLVDRLSDRSIESKKWDGYVVVLSSSHPGDDGTKALFDITYNLNQVRRVIRVGIEPTAASVSRGLRAVLPLSHTRVEAILTDPLVALRTRLLADGVDAQQVDDAMASFESDPGSTEEDLAPEDDYVEDEEDGDDDS